MAWNIAQALDPQQQHPEQHAADDAEHDAIFEDPQPLLAAGPDVAIVPYVAPAALVGLANCIQPACIVPHISDQQLVAIYSKSSPTSDLRTLVHQAICFCKGPRAPPVHRDVSIVAKAFLEQKHMNLASLEILAKSIGVDARTLPRRLRDLAASLVECDRVNRGIAEALTTQSFLPGKLVCFSLIRSLTTKRRLIWLQMIWPRTRQPSPQLQLARPLAQTLATAHMNNSRRCRSATRKTSTNSSFARRFCRPRNATRCCSTSGAHLRLPGFLIC